MVNRIIFRDIRHSCLYIEYKNKNNQWHRKNGPARIWGDDSEEWYYNGRCHRLDGPAISYFAGQDKEWYYNDEKIHCHSQEEFERLIKLRLLW